ncbi:MAG: hypothetical protein PHP17_04160 [Candidatus Omnitrophica bacterium]|nr:hypothetical protein [Candidatus Omnitrophota bacterium]
MSRNGKYLTIAVFLLVIVSGFAAKALCRSNSIDETAAPRLSYPIEPEVVVTGDTLDFKWWPATGGVRGYEFVLYKGGGPSGDVLVQKTLQFANLIKVDAKLLEDGKTYTWTLRQISDSGQKSDQSFNTFKVLKK